MKRGFIRAAAVTFAICCLSQLAVGKEFASYTSTNQLVWDKEFRTAVASFAGSLRASFFWKNDLLWKQTLEGLGGPPEDIVKASPTLYLASACRAHSCMEKSAAVFEAPNRIVALGLIEYGCFRDKSCSDRPTLQVFVRQRTVQAERAITEWADDAVGEFDIKLTVLK